MVYVPILKIDLPEPSIQELLPGLVHAFVNTCTRVFDAVHDYLRPLTPDEEAVLYTATIAHLPKEFRKARKRIVEKNIADEDKMSEELEDASYAYYRRRMREQVAGYSDEETEDVTFRRLMNPFSTSRDLLDEQQPQLQDAADAAAAQSTLQAAAAADVLLPGRVRRVTVTTVAGGAGLALGAGVLKLAHVLSKLRHKGKPKSKRAGQAPGSRRQSGDGSAARRKGTPSGAGGRTTPRTTPRQR
ncbi:hypothetical protein OEZ85_014421 [Tetradesmus obliquus]|uniref:Uncharacterized protein n=1 Tax=Tetradesmus obliquus TaxID=3088 RepID=A0ABY8U828_TETOB|nr:hypothetical protein OEZ85_014421 [Tetradesmus obliquus]